MNESTDMKRRPPRLACPVCKREADGDTAFHEGIREFQFFICDTSNSRLATRETGASIARAHGLSGATVSRIKVGVR